MTHIIYIYIDICMYVHSKIWIMTYTSSKHDIWVCPFKNDGMIWDTRKSIKITWLMTICFPWFPHVWLATEWDIIPYYSGRFLQTLDGFWMIYREQRLQQDGCYWGYHKTWLRSRFEVSFQKVSSWFEHLWGWSWSWDINHSIFTYQPVVKAIFPMPPVK